MLADHGVLAFAVARVGRGVARPAVARCVIVVAIIDDAGEGTFKVGILQIRRLVDMIHTKGLGEVDAEPLAALSALRGDHDGTIETT